jgi:hypothetical protein
MNTAVQTTNMKIISLSCTFGLALLSLSSAIQQTNAAEPLNTWSTRTSPYGSTNTWQAIVYGGGRFVTVGTRGQAAISTNGTDWLPGGANTLKTFYGLAYGNGAYVAVGAGGVVFTSSDGTSWSPQSTGTSAHLYHVNYGNGLFVAVGGGGTVLSSPNGVTWTPRGNGATNQWEACAFGNGTQVLVGYRSGSYTRSGASAGLSNWDVRDTGASYYLSGLTFGAGKFVACGYAGTVQSSTDGVNWTSPTNAGNAWLNFTTYDNNTFMAVGEMGVIKSSTDGVTWTNRFVASSTTLNGVAYGNNAWVAVGTSSRILQSDSLTAVTIPTQPLLTEATKFGSVFSFKFTGIIGQTYAVQASTNLASWTTLTNLLCTNSPTSCTLAGQTMPKRFYRVVRP